MIVFLYSSLVKTVREDQDMQESVFSLREWRESFAARKTPHNFALECIDGLILRPARVIHLRHCAPGSSHEYEVEMFYIGRSPHPVLIEGDMAYRLDHQRNEFFYYQPFVLQPGSIVFYCRGATRDAQSREIIDRASATIYCCPSEQWTAHFLREFLTRVCTNS